MTNLDLLQLGLQQGGKYLVTFPETFHGNLRGIFLLSKMTCIKTLMQCTDIWLVSWRNGTAFKIFYNWCFIFFFKKGPEWLIRRLDFTLSLGSNVWLLVSKSSVHVIGGMDNACRGCGLSSPTVSNMLMCPWLRNSTGTRLYLHRIWLF